MKVTTFTPIWETEIWAPLFCVLGKTYITSFLVPAKFERLNKPRLLCGRSKIKIWKWVQCKARRWAQWWGAGGFCTWLPSQQLESQTESEVGERLSTGRDRRAWHNAFDSLSQMFLILLVFFSQFSFKPSLSHCYSVFFHFAMTNFHLAQKKSINMSKEASQLSRISAGKVFF